MKTGYSSQLRLRGFCVFAFGVNFLDSAKAQKNFPIENN